MFVIAARKLDGRGLIDDQVILEPLCLNNVAAVETP